MVTTPRHQQLRQPETPTVCPAFSTLSFFFSCSSGDLLTSYWTSGSGVTTEHLVLFQSDSRFLLHQPHSLHRPLTVVTGCCSSPNQQRSDEKSLTVLHSWVLSQCNQYCASITRESEADLHDCRSSVSISEATAHVARSQNHGRTSAASQDD